jgi:hypothetical protein
MVAISTIVATIAISTIVATMAISTIVATIAMTTISIFTISKVPVGAKDSIVLGSATRGPHMLGTVVDSGLTVLIAVGGSYAIVTGKTLYIRLDI